MLNVSHVQIIGKMIINHLNLKRNVLGIAIIDTVGLFLELIMDDGRDLPQLGFYFKSGYDSSSEHHKHTNFV